jgi:hypothetical protein
MVVGEYELNCSSRSGLFLDGGVEMALGNEDERCFVQVHSHNVRVVADRDSFPVFALWAILPLIESVVRSSCRGRFNGPRR